MTNYRFTNMPPFGVLDGTDDKSRVMNVKVGTMRRIAILLVVVGVISTVVGIYTIFLSPYTIWGDYSQCRFTQSAGCQVVTKAPEYGLILIAIGALLYTSTRTKKAGVVGKEASSQVPPS